MKVDLSLFAAPIRSLVCDGIETFLDANGDKPVASVAVYSCPIYGWITINVETDDHDCDHVALWKQKGFCEANFNDNCPDFAFQHESTLEFKEWSGLYWEELAVRIVLTRAGKQIELGRGDLANDEYSKPYFDLLLDFMKELDAERAFDALNRRNDFRLGVQILDSDLVEFWLAT